MKWKSQKSPKPCYTAVVGNRRSPMRIILTRWAEPTQNAERPLSKWLPVLNFKGYWQQWWKEKAKKDNIPGDCGLQRERRAWAPRGTELAGQAGLETVSEETAVVFSYRAGTLWIEKITLWKYPPRSPSTPAKLWICRLTPMLKGGNWIFFQNSSWETKLHSLYAFFQGFESIWGQTCSSCSASFWTAAGIAGRTSSSCMPATHRYTISYVQVHLMLLLGKIGTNAVLSAVLVLMCKTFLCNCFNR